jgi:hypothetical protein
MGQGTLIERPYEESSHICFIQPRTLSSYYSSFWILRGNVSWDMPWASRLFHFIHGCLTSCIEIFGYDVSEMAFSRSRNAAPMFFMSVIVSRIVWYDLQETRHLLQDYHWRFANDNWSSFHETFRVISGSWAHWCMTWGHFSGLG